jgi:hypothetical protein
MNKASDSQKKVLKLFVKNTGEIVYFCTKLHQVKERREANHANKITTLGN